MNYPHDLRIRYPTADAHECQVWVAVSLACARLFKALMELLTDGTLAQRSVRAAIRQVSSPRGSHVFRGCLDKRGHLFWLRHVNRVAALDLDNCLSLSNNPDQDT